MNKNKMNIFKLYSKPICLATMVFIVGLMAACETPGGFGDDDDEDTGSTSASTTGGRKVILTIPEFWADSTGERVWVKGYIVGECKQNISNAKFAPPFSYGTSILIAEEAGETVMKKVVPVELKSGTKARAALNLADNPSMLGHEVKVYGKKQTYFGLPGLKEVSQFDIPEE